MDRNDVLMHYRQELDAFRKDDNDFAVKCFYEARDEMRMQT